MERETIFNSIEALDEWVMKENFEGWDPYDIASSPLFANISPEKLMKLNYLLWVIRELPFNLRPYLKIKKYANPQSISLFMLAYVRLYSLKKDEKYKERLAYLYSTLKGLSLINYTGYHSWGTPFKVMIKNRFYYPSEPGIMNTSLSIIALSNYYSIFHKNEVVEIIKSAQEFLKSMFVSHKNLHFFLYRPSLKNIFIINGSAWAVSAIAHSIKVNYDHKLVEMGVKALNTILKFQNEMGIWPYSIDLKTKKIYWQTDFHQGFIVDSLIEFLPLLPKDMQRNAIKTLKKGGDVYLNKTFTAAGFSYYRYPSLKYPIDIMNQAQGILTSANLYRFFKDTKYLERSVKIAKWTIKNMQDPSGYFYYQKWPFFTNKIPYMRWGQAWMLLALSILLKNMGVEEK